ncbi:MAG TPA: hypothetical protein VN962_19565 [Polyangia bacterium]|nr:hypothetical protein [Polyangia bacterium]
MRRVDRRTFLQGLGAATGAIGAGTLAGTARAARPAVLDRLDTAEIAVAARAAPWGADLHDGAAVELRAGTAARRQLPSGALDLRAAPVPGDPDAVDLFATFRARAGAPAGWLALQLDCTAWSVENYLLLPGCCYAGNRFESRFAAYPPLLTEPADIGPHVPPIITDIPRLNRHAGPSRLDVASVDLATGALAMFAPALHLGLILLVDPISAVGPTGLTVAEAEDRRRAMLQVATPFVRHPGRGAEARRPAPPPPRPGQTVTLRARLLAFPCEAVPALLARLFSVRKALGGGKPRPASMSLSASFAAHEAAANARWLEKPGLLAVGDRATAYTTWQNGWCGGFGLTWPLLVAGSPTSRERALRTIDFALTGGQGPAGFFHAVSDGSHWYDDGFTAPLPGRAKTGAGGHPRWHLVRRTADSLFYLLDQLAWLDRPGPGHDAADLASADARWTRAARAAADALTRLWERHRQFGQIVDVETGDLIVGGSSSAGLAPAALVRAADRFKEARYRDVALESGRAFFDRFVAGGLTCGGPGDALQCPDSESAAALVESFMALYEATGDRTWVERARTAAHLLATWVVSGDGDGCLDGARRVTGAVMPDAQNRAPGPGLVLLAGDALLRLARATGDRGFLELLRDIIRQADPPPAAREASATCPDAGVHPALRAAVVPADGLCDAVAMLTATRVPGVYALIDKAFVFALDAVEARVKERMPGRLVLSLRNPTGTDASVRVMAEMASDAERPLAPGALLDGLAVAVPAGRAVDVVVPPVAR